MRQPVPISRVRRPQAILGRRVTLTVMLGALGLSGCASYKDQTQALRNAWGLGNYPQAAEIAQNQAKKSGSDDAVLWNLEAGATTRAAGQTQASLATFNQADQLFDEWDTRPPVSISRETASVLYNQTALPYRGADYDRIMESTYQALNYLQLGRLDEARVELTRALERQRLAVSANAQRIEDAQNAATQSSADAQREGANATDVYDVPRAEKDPRFNAGYQSNFSELDSMHFYAPYVNPFSTYLQGLCLMGHPQSASDLESARVDLQRVRGMIGSNPYIDADVALANDLANGGQMPDLTYVIFETGQAPIREEVRLDLPLFVVSRSVPYVGVAFPRLRFNSQFTRGLTIYATGSPALHTAVLCDMDLVIAQEFKNELPSIVVKTLLSAGIKAAAQYGIHEAAKNNDILNVLTEVAGVIYQYTTNKADLRTWTTLPKQFVFCRLPTPPDRHLGIESDSGGPIRAVDLPPGRVTLVYVKSTSFGGPLSIQSFPI